MTFRDLVKTIVPQEEKLREINNIVEAAATTRSKFAPTAMLFFLIHCPMYRIGEFVINASRVKANMVQYNNTIKGIYTPPQKNSRNEYQNRNPEAIVT